MRIGQTVGKPPVRHAEHDNDQCCPLLDRVDSDATDEQMADIAIRRHFIRKYLTPLPGALDRFLHKRGCRSRLHLADLRRDIHILYPQMFLHVPTVGLIAPRDGEFLLSQLQDRHRHRVEVILQRLILIHCKRDIVQIDLADGGIVLRFCRVFKADLSSFLITLQQIRHGDRFGIVKALQLGTADLIEELDLCLSFHTLHHRFDPEADGHLDQSADDDAAGLILFILTDELHIQLDRIERDGLQDIRG